MNFLKVAWRDISSIFKNRFIRVSVIAIIIVPLLYSLLYLDAFWDPYARIKHMPVAVVNEDKGSTKDGEKVNYGEDVIKNLKDNSEVGWRFITREDAEKGVIGEQYYAMFIIPEDFSEKALSATKGKPEQPAVLYSANEKRNFLAAQINGKVLDKLKAEITKNMSKEYTTAVFDNLYELKDGMQKASDGSKELADGLVTAKDGTTKLKDGVGQLNGKVPEMVDGVGKLLEGSSTLTGKLGELKAQVPDMTKGVSQLYDGSSKLENGLSQLNGQMPTMGTGVKKLNDAYKAQIVPSTGKLKDGAAQLSAGLAATKDGVTQLSDASTKLSGGSTLLTDGSSKLNAGYSQMKQGISDLKNGTSQVAGGVDVLIDNTKNSQAALQQAVASQLGEYLKTHPEAMKDANMQQFLNTLDTLNKTATDEKNVAMLQNLQTGAHKAATGAGQLEQGSLAFVEGSQKYAESTTAFAQGAAEFTKGAGVFSEKTAVAIGASAQISGGLDQLYTAMSGEFANGLSQLNDKVPTLGAGVQQLTNGSMSLSGGLSQLNSKMPTLADGTEKLYAGSSQITEGITTLNGKLPELKDGVNKLYEGTTELDDGMTKLADGSKELNDKLTEGYNEMSGNLKNDSETMGEAFSEPVVMNEKPINPVKNYGTGFAPYFIPLSLWVGALMMFFVITDKVDEDIKVSPASVVAGKFLSYGFIGFIQAVLASGIVMLLGLEPANIPLYFLTNILLANVFIAIIQCMVFLLGQVGRLLSIVLLILQLTACAGTFPLEVVPKFFKVLNPFMPFTYAVSALREVISGVDYAILSKDIVVLMGILFAFLFISILMKGHADKMQQVIQDRKDQVTNTL